jgi:hypothetical protein
LSDDNNSMSYLEQHAAKLYEHATIEAATLHGFLQRAAGFIAPDDAAANAVQRVLDGRMEHLDLHAAAAAAQG